MKVLQINSVCGFGSTGRIAADLYRLLRDQGGQGLIAYGRGDSPADIPAIRIASDAEFKFHGAASRITDRQGFYSKAATKKLIEAAQAFDPDVIHLHNLHGYYLHLPTLFHWLAQADKPVVWTLHDCWAFTGHCSHFEYVGCDRWKNACHDCPQKKEYPASLLMDNSRRNYLQKKELFTSVKQMMLVTPSDWLKGLVQESFLGKYPVKRIYNGIDLSVFKPTNSNIREKFNLKDKKIVLGVASVWSPRKGLEDLCELSHRLGEGWKVAVVGLTPEQKQALPAGMLGITRTDSVQQLAELYTAADVFVNPTLEDNFPTTNLEALACGTPVVTYRTGGSPEAVDGTCGAVTGQNTADALAQAIQSGLASWTAEACVQRAQLFDSKARYSEYLALYQTLIK